MHTLPPLSLHACAGIDTTQPTPTHEMSDDTSFPRSRSAITRIRYARGHGIDLRCQTWAKLRRTCSVVSARGPRAMPPHIGNQMSQALAVTPRLTIPMYL